MSFYDLKMVQSGVKLIEEGSSFSILNVELLFRI